MSINAGLFSSATDEWETPQELFDELNAEFEFNLDACADFNNWKWCVVRSGELGSGESTRR